jgi:hypothetical protein
MDYKEILNILAPCGLDCTKCLGFEKGPIGKHAKELQALLNGFGPEAARNSSCIPAFKKYSSFEEILGVIAGVDCAGCRNNETKYPHCSIARCFKDKEIDFCFQCIEYPCNPEGIDSDLRKKWIEINNKMKKIGVEAYYEETKDEPRYK